MAPRFLVALLVSLTCAVLPALARAQQPQPFPKPADRTARPASPKPSAPPEKIDPAPKRDRRIPEDKPLTSRGVERSARAQPTSNQPQATRALSKLEPTGEPVPTEAMLGFPLFSGAQFIKSYNAGRGQRYYLFGVAGTYTEVVSFYRTALDERGDRVFDEPPVHIFEEGRFDEDRMAFPPSVTVKDYTWGGSRGYLDPRPGAKPQRYRTVIQIVPPPRGVER